MQGATRSDALAGAARAIDTQRADISPWDGCPDMWIIRTDIPDHMRTPYDVVMVQTEYQSSGPHYRYTDTTAPDHHAMIMASMAMARARGERQRIVFIEWRHTLPDDFGIELHFTRRYTHHIAHNLIQLCAVDSTIPLTIHLRKTPKAGYKNTIDTTIQHHDHDAFIALMRRTIATLPIYDSAHHKMACLTTLSQQLPNILTPRIFDTMQDRYTID